MHVCPDAGTDYRPEASETRLSRRGRAPRMWPPPVEPYPTGVLPERSTAVHDRSFLRFLDVAPGLFHVKRHNRFGSQASLYVRGGIGSCSQHNPGEGACRRIPRGRWTCPESQRVR